MALNYIMKALSDPTRRTILAMLKTGERSAGEIAENFNISMAAISKHLSVLKDAELVKDRRKGKYIFYSFNAKALDEALMWIQDMKK